MEGGGFEGCSFSSMGEEADNQCCCNIPRTTMADHVQQRRMKVGAGRPTILTQSEEKEQVVVTCQVLQRMGFGLTREAVGIVVQDYIRDYPERAGMFGSSGPELTKSCAGNA